MTDRNNLTNLELAILFHETYERLAPSFGYETRPDTKLFDPESKNGRLMVAVCGEILARRVVEPTAEVKCPCGTAYLRVDSGYVPVCDCAVKNSVAVNRQAELTAPRDHAPGCPYDNGWPCICGAEAEQSGVIPAAHAAPALPQREHYGSDDDFTKAINEAMRKLADKL